MRWGPHPDRRGGGAWERKKEEGMRPRLHARRLAELVPAFAWDLPAIESLDIYDIVQDYRITVRGFTDPATGVLLDRDGLAQNVDAIFAERVLNLDTLGHLARLFVLPESSSIYGDSGGTELELGFWTAPGAAIDLRMNDLLTDCFKKLESLDPIEQEQVMQFLQNVPGGPGPL
ncbi:hypothetical protein E2562_039067 [Oryza meyeriana var. granulata]|uniref:Uncharacterized protein n=1 Tax=Oryza meyeriana var. granulata TaxID=110450 RepID=A0A6G1BQ93_9ORYZ|nr:hypothetical protein E2562_039067 [Oryza meyeriana var. granulata]